MTKKKSGRESLVVASKVKEYVKKSKFLSSGDLAAAVSEKVYDLLDGAVARARENGRRTVRGHDV